MAALHRSLFLALLALGACSLPGRSSSGGLALFGTSSEEGSEVALEGASAPPPPSGRALTRGAPAAEPHPEDRLLRLPRDLELTAAETVNAERLGRVQVEEDKRVIVLTPLPCRIAEQEATPTDATDREGCRVANQLSFGARSQQVWTLPPGRYTVRVVNQEVDWPVGLWLRSTKGESLAAAGGGARGETIEVEVQLTPGTYLVSLPLLPTPDYRWQVERAPR